MDGRTNFLLEETIPMAVARKRARTAPGVEETFGRRMARLRKQAGYSQVTFAEEIGISPRMVAYYEVQTDRPPTYLIATIAKTLAVSADQLLGLEPVGKRAAPLNQQLLRRLRRIGDLPAHHQRALLTTIDAFLKGAPKR